MNRLNVFNYYKDKKQSHEDVLTRNFMILLKNIPFVQAGFIELIRKQNPEINIPSIILDELKVSEVYTQVNSGTSVLSDKQGYKILSIIISDDTFKTQHEVTESTREARYDGVVLCDPQWLFIIENKPSVHKIWEEQLDPNYIDAENNELIRNPCALSWRSIIGMLNNGLDSLLSSNIEKTIVSDFLEYVDCYYPTLNPYDNFKLCKENIRLLEKRCNEILLKCFPKKDLLFNPKWGHYYIMGDDGIILNISLYYDSNNIVLCMNAGDTMNAARKLYERIQIKKLNDLVNSNIEILPNLKFDFNGTGIAWFSTTSITMIDYIEYWQDSQKNSQINQVSMDDVRSFYDNLVLKKIIDPNDEYLAEKMTSKHYQKFNVCPGLSIKYYWNINQAKELDSKGQFFAECKKKIESVFSLYK